MDSLGRGVLAECQAAKETEAGDVISRSGAAQADMPIRVPMNSPMCRARRMVAVSSRGSAPL